MDGDHNGVGSSQGVSDRREATLPPRFDAARKVPGSNLDASFRDLFQDHPQPMWVVDRRGWGLLAVNRAALGFFQGDSQPANGNNSASYIPADLVRFLRQHARAMEEQVSPDACPTTRWLDRRRATLSMFEVAVQPIRYGDSEAFWMRLTDLGCSRDAIRDLTIDERRFRALIENSSDVVMLLAPDGTILYDSPSPGKVLGYGDLNFVGLSAFDFVHPDDRTEMRRQLEHLGSDSSATVTVRFRALHQDGSYRWLEAVGNNLLAEPSVQAIVVSYRDISDRKQAEEKLRESEERHRLIADLTSDYAYMCSVQPDGKIRLEAATEGFTRVTGYTVAEVQKPGQEAIFVHPDEFLQLEERMRHWLAGERDNGEMRFRRKDGVTRWIRYSLRPLLDAKSGRVAWLLGAGQDITDRKGTETALDLLGKRNALILASVAEGIYGLDAQGCATFVNPAAARMLGRDPNELLGRSSHELMHHTRPDGSPYRLEECPILACLLDGNVHEVHGEVFWRKDGTSFPVDYVSTPIWENGERVGAVVTFADITERKRAEERFQESAERLRTLHERLLEIQERERRHLANELHDEVGQLLTGINLALGTGLQLGPDQLASAARDAQGMLKELTSRVRDISMRLRPPVLDDLGLLPALLGHIERYTAQTGVDVLFEHEGLERRPYPPEVETAAYRIIQEALTNVARHARVREVIVRLWKDEHLLYIQVEDEGVGFDPKAVQAAGTSSGVSGMQERALLLGGYVAVHSKPGAGTRLAAELPVSGSEERRRPHVFEPILGRRSSDRPPRVETDFDDGARDSPDR